MGLGKAMIIGGIGCRRGAPAADVTAAIEMAFARTSAAKDRLRAIATAVSKKDEIGIATAAAILGVPLVLLSQRDLQAASERTLTRSARVMELFRVSSIAEAAALAAGGPTARLLGARVTAGSVTCALTETDPAP
jgi:cobalt-precorrin 5A hydrolase